MARGSVRAAEIMRKFTPRCGSFVFVARVEQSETRVGVEWGACPGFRFAQHRATRVSLRSTPGYAVCVTAPSARRASFIEPDEGEAVSRTHQAGSARSRATSR